MHSEAVESVRIEGNTVITKAKVALDASRREVSEQKELIKAQAMELRHFMDAAGGQQKLIQGLQKKMEVMSVILTQS